jgi:hypothetical protein
MSDSKPSRHGSSRAGSWLVLAAIVTLPAAAGAAITVEQYTATATVDFAMPGAAEGALLRFDVSSFAFGTLDFAPGAVSFAGQPVDFDGTEPQWLALAYDGVLRLPSVPGPGGGSGGGGGGCMVVGPPGTPWTYDLENVLLGANWGADRLDIVPGTYPVEQKTTSWDSPLVPQLAGRQAAVQSNAEVTAVDAVNGILTLSLDGVIQAGDHAVPALGEVALFCLLAGLLGIALCTIRFARRAS